MRASMLEVAAVVAFLAVMEEIPLFLEVEAAAADFSIAMEL